MGNYPPPHHQDHDINHMIEVIKAYPLATVVSVKNGTPLVTHLPLIYRETDGKLIGHKYILKPDSPRMEAALDYIKMFEITITHWEGKFKLSQDKKKSDIDNAKQELIRANQKSIEAFLDKVFV